MKEQTLQIAPTVMDHVDATDAVMGEEIFGPILPVLTYESIGQAERFILSRPHPLALYFSPRTQRRRTASCGLSHSAADVSMTPSSTWQLHGWDSAALGRAEWAGYHGKKSFETFSHEKSIVKKYNWIDLPVRYQPYTTKKQRLLRFFCGDGI